MRPWDGLITAEEIAVYRRRSSAFLQPQAIGRQPAILVVGAQYNFTGERSEPVAVAVEKYRFSCGEHAWTSIPKIQGLLKVARQNRVPIIYTRDYELPDDANTHELTRGRQFIEELAPHADDTVFEKEGYSAFFCTQLPRHLLSNGIDTVIIVGGSTSGCVRATATDAHDYKLRTFLVEECVFDRAPMPHRYSLFDIAAKFASVVTLAEMEAMLEDWGSSRRSA